MLNHSASLAMSTSILNALPGKLDIKRHLPSILFLSKLYFGGIICSFERTLCVNIFMHCVLIMIFKLYGEDQASICHFKLLAYTGKIYIFTFIPTLSHNTTE